MANFEQQVKQAIRIGPDVQVNGLDVVSDTDGIDIGEAINIRLKQIGENKRVLVAPDEYTKSNLKPLQTPIESQARGQGVNFLGSKLELDDGIDEEPIQVKHDGFNVDSLQIDCNQANNNLNAALTTDSGIKGVNVVDIEPVNVPVGVQFNQVENSFLRASEIETGAVVTEIGVDIQGCSTVEIRGAGIEGYTDKGLNIVNSDEIIVSGAFLEAAGDTNVNANAAIRLAGSRDCDISNSIVKGNGDVSKGVLYEAFDVGGPNERISDDNTVDIKVQGVTDIAHHIRDSNIEAVAGTIDGEYDTGKTSQAFLIDSPNGLGTPGHDINLKAKNCDRVTDTNIGSQTAGVTLQGQFSSIDNTSTARFAGTSQLSVTSGPGTAKPLFRVETDTSIETSIRPQRSTTDGQGEVSVDWSDFVAFEDKPAIAVELEEAGSWYIKSINSDADGFFTDATIQVINMDGTEKGSGLNTGLIVLGT